MENVTVSDVAVAAVTVPTAPLLNVTTLLAAVVLKLVPAIVSVAALGARLAVLDVTVGAVTLATTAATWTADPLERVLVDTDAFKLPAAAGRFENVTRSDVVVAAETVPVAPPTNVTTLLPAIGSNPKPLMIRFEPFKARLVAFDVTTGLTAATCTAAAAATPLVVTVAVSVPAHGLVE